MDEEQGLRAFGESGRWLAGADGLKASGDFFRVEGLEFGAVAEDFNFFGNDFAAGKIREQNFVSEMRAGVGTVERDRGVLNGEEERRHFFFWCGGEGSSDKSREDGEDDQSGDGEEIVARSWGHGCAPKCADDGTTGDRGGEGSRGSKEGRGGRGGERHCGWAFGAQQCCART